MGPGVESVVCRLPEVGEPLRSIPVTAFFSSSKYWKPAKLTGPLGQWLCGGHYLQANTGFPGTFPPMIWEGSVQSLLLRTPCPGNAKWLCPRSPPSR